MSDMHPFTILKPIWVTHQDDKGKTKPVIYSLHIRPDGSRLATAGQDAKIKIWNMAAVCNPALLDDPMVPTLMSTLTTHNGSVLCVRWSNGAGRYLASGSDDTIIMIWELDGSDAGISTTFGATESNHEHWKPVRRLAGHHSDVTDLAWSPNNRYLASCSLDGKVFIWDGRTFDMLQKLELHTGYVKGLTWDPAGKYLASQSDDRTVKIWRTSDWGLETSIVRDFELSPTTTFFRRPSWSPEGTHLVASNAVNGSVSVSAVIKRADWTSDLTLVGHDAPTEVAAFNPKVFRPMQSPEDPDSSSRPLCICALGSQDKAISIWETQSPRPLVLADLAEHSILDISWHPNGQLLAASSYDGTVVVVAFNDDHFGTPYSAEEQEEMLDMFGGKRLGTVIPESPTQLHLEDERAINNKMESSKRISDLMEGNGMMGVSTNSLASTTISNEANEFQNFTENVNMVDLERTETPLISATGDSERSSTTGGMVTAQTVNAVPPVVVQNITITKEGKKRIQPQFIRSISGAVSNGTHTPQPALHSSIPRASLAQGTGNSVLSSFSPAGRLDPPHANWQSAGFNDGLDSAVVGNKRKDAPREGTEREKSKKGKGNELDIMNGAVQSFIARPTRLSSVSDVSQVRLAVPKVMTRLLQKSTDNSPVMIECDNTLRGNEACKIVYSYRGSMKWEDFLPSPVIALCSGAEQTAAATEEGCLYIWTPAGRRLLPCINLEAPASFLTYRGHYLLCITAVGLLSVWNVRNQTAVVSSISIAPVLKSASLPLNTLTPSVQIVGVTIRLSNGAPSIVTSAGEGFTYHLGLCVWTRVADSAFLRSDYILTDDARTEQGPLMLLQQKAYAHGALGNERQGNFARMLLETNREVENVLSLRHIETQLASARMLCSPDEYKHWLVLYARRLADDDLHDRTEELCSELSGYHIGQYVDPEDNNTILGMTKKSLLRLVLPILAKNRKLQRIVNEYHNSLQNEESIHLDA